MGSVRIDARASELGGQPLSGSWKQPVAYAGTVHPGPFGDSGEVKQSQAAAVSLLTSGMGREGQGWLSSSHWNPLADHALSQPLSRQRR